MTEIYKIEDEFSVCDKNCKYLNTCLDTYVDYYKNVNPYDTQLILAKSNIGNEINDMEEIDYLDYFDQNFDKVDNLYTDLILKPRGLKKKVQFKDKTIDAAELTPDFDKINYNEQPIQDVKMIDNVIDDNNDIEIQNISQGEGDIANIVKMEENKNIVENINKPVTTNVNENITKVNENVTNVNENINKNNDNINKNNDNINKPVTTNIDARTTNIDYNPAEEKPIMEIKEEQQENNMGIKSDLSDFSLRENEGKIKDDNIFENKNFENEKNILPLETGENLHREKLENTENKILENKKIPEGKFEYTHQSSNLRENKPEVPMKRPIERPVERPDIPIQEKKENKDNKGDKDKSNISISLEDDSGSRMPPMMNPGYSGDPRMIQDIKDENMKLKTDLENERKDSLGKDNSDELKNVISEKDKVIAELRDELKTIDELSGKKCDKEKKEQMDFLEIIYNHLMEMKVEDMDNNSIDNIKADQQEISGLIDNLGDIFTNKNNTRDAAGAGE